MSAKYTPQLADDICSNLAQGKSLVAVCKELEIPYRDVFQWLRDNPGFADNYARAREAQIDYIAEDVLTISDDPQIPSDDKRVRIDARKWYAGKMQPKKYGERVQTDLNASVTVTTKEQRDAAVAAALSADS